MNKLIIPVFGLVGLVVLFYAVVGMIFLHTEYLAPESEKTPTTAQSVDATWCAMDKMLEAQSMVLTERNVIEGKDIQ